MADDKDRKDKRDGRRGLTCIWTKGIWWHYILDWRESPLVSEAISASGRPGATHAWKFRVGTLRLCNMTKFPVPPSLLIQPPVYVLRALSYKIRTGRYLITKGKLWLAWFGIAVTWRTLSRVSCQSDLFHPINTNPDRETLWKHVFHKEKPKP